MKGMSEFLDENLSVVLLAEEEAGSWFDFPAHHMDPEEAEEGWGVEVLGKTSLNAKGWAGSSGAGVRE